MQNFILSFSIIFASLLAGYAFNACIMKGIIPLTAETTTQLRLYLQKTALLVVNPIAFCGAVWIADLSVGRYLSLPFIGVAALATGMVLGLAGSRLLGLAPSRAGVYIGSASFTNIGNIGGLAVFILLGEPGFALIPFYKLFEEFWYYSVIFPIARSYGERANPASSGSTSTSDSGSGPALGITRVLRDPFLIVSASATTLGLLLNFSPLERPDFYTGLNLVLVPLSSFLMLFAIGMRLRFRLGNGHLKPALLLTAGKSLIVPAIACGLGLAVGLGSSPDGLGLRLVLILAAMPTGFLSLVPPTLYKLDQDFAGSLWLVSNGAILLILPVLGFILSL